MGIRQKATLQAKIGVSFSLCIFLFYTAFAKTSDTNAREYEEALTLLEQQQVEAAAEKLSSLVQTAPSAEAYYNLALAYDKLHKRAESTWALASAQALGGVAGDEALTRKLQRNIPVELWPLTEHPMSIALKRASRSLSSSTWDALGILFWLVGAGLFASRFFTASKARIVGFATACLLLGALAIMFSHTQQNMLKSPWAVAMKATSLFEAPSSGSEKIQNLPMGTRVTFGEELSGFAQVTLPTREEGWVPLEDFKRVLSKD